MAVKGFAPEMQILSFAIVGKPEGRCRDIENSFQGYKGGGIASSTY
jgi:hypothetical protein